MPLPRGNRLLDGLTEPETELLTLHARIVQLREGDPTSRQRMPMLTVDFPTDALMAVEGMLENGSTYELASVGNEAFVEIDAALDSDISLRSAYCQFAGEVVRVTLDDFQAALRKSPRFARRVRHAVRARVFVTEQNQLCNLKHTIGQRLARWLLVTQTRRMQTEFDVTHDRLAMIIGSRRASITDAVARLVHAGAIEGRRRELVVRDVRRLEQMSCECFVLCRNAIENALLDG